MRTFLRLGYAQVSCLLSLLVLITLVACQPSGISPQSTADAATDLALLLSDSLGLDPCLQADTLSPAQVPAPILDSLQLTHPQDPVVQALRFAGSSDTTYVVHLQSGLVRVYRPDGQFVGGGDPSQLFTGGLIGLVSAFVQQHLPGHTIHEIEWKWHYQGTGSLEVEFTDGSELYFDLQGNTLCFTVDDHGGHSGNHSGNTSNPGQGSSHSGYFGGHVPSGQVPDTIWQWLDQHYPGAEVDEVKYLSLCDTAYGFVVKLENSYSGGSHGGDRYLAFAPDGTYLYKFREEDADEVLPSSLYDSLEAQYPGFEPDDVMVQTLPNGDIRYEVEMKARRGGDDRFVLVWPDGTVVCEREEND